MNESKVTGKESSTALLEKIGVVSALNVIPESEESRVLTLNGCRDATLGYADLRFASRR
jgi:hypothetical protein